MPKPKRRAWPARAKTKGMGMNKEQALTGQALKNVHVFGKMARRHYANTVLTWVVLRLQPPS